MNSQTYEIRSQGALERQMKKERQMQKRTGTPDLRLTKQILRYRLVDILVNRKRTQIQTEVSLHDVEDLDIFEQMYNRKFVERQIFLSNERTTLIETMNSVNDNVSLATNTAMSLANNANRTMENINGAVSKFGTTADQASTILEQLKVAMTPMKFEWNDLDMTPILMKLAKVLVNFGMAKDGWKIASFLFNVSVEFGSEIVDVIKNWLFTPSYHSHLVEKQGLDLGSFETFAHIKETVMGNQKMTVTGLAIAIAAIMQFALGLPKGMDTEKMLAFFGNRCRHLKSMADFFKSAGDLFKATAEWCIEQVFPGVLNHSLEAYLDGYTIWSQRVISLVDPENPIAERVKKEKALIYEINNLYKRGLHYSRNISTLRIQPDQSDHFQKCFALCTAFLKEADHSGVLGNRPRTKPLMIHLFGESGVGKSGVTWPLATDLNATLCDNLKQAKDCASEIYFRNAEQEFWDGYAGQNVCVWDDFGQLADSSANPNPEYFEIIRAGNCAPYPLHMASLEEKKKTKFISQYVILTSNVLDQKVNSLTFPSAFRRRIDFCLKVVNKKGYTKTGVDAETGAVVERLDVSKCADGIDTDCYEFIRYNPETKQAYCGKDGNAVVYTYDELIDELVSAAGASFDISMTFNENLSDRIDQNRFDKIKSRFTKALLVKAERQIQVNYSVGDDDVFYSLPFDQEIVEVDVRTIPSVKTMLKTFREKASKFLTIKNVLVSIGVLIAGFGVYKLFKNDEDDTTKMVKEASVSGDSRTRNNKKIRTEAGVSGDSKTRNAKRIVTEASVSGDAKTRKHKTIVTEASVSGDSKTNKKRLIQSEIWAPSPGKKLVMFLRQKAKTEDGWVSYQTIREKLGQYSDEEFAVITTEDSKNRLENDPVGERIRARQGHMYAINPDLVYEPTQVTTATHFTTEEGIKPIMESGIKRMRRAHVHAFPGILYDLPKGLPGRTFAFHIDLTKCENKYQTGNGYIMIDYVPTNAFIGYHSIISREASVSGDSVTKKNKTVVSEMVQKEAFADMTAQQLILHKIFANQYVISTKTFSVTGTFVIDNVMVTVKHLYEHLRQVGNITITNTYGAEFTVPTADLIISFIEYRNGDEKDAMLIQFPRYVPAHTNILKHFQEMPELAERRAQVCVPTLRRIGDRLYSHILGNTDCKIEDRTLEFEDETVQARDTLVYALNTTKGDCGSPVIVNDTSFRRKIAGIHMAGEIGGRTAFGQSVTQDDIKRAMKNFKVIDFDADELPNICKSKVELQFNVNYSQDDILKMLDMPAATFSFLGGCSMVKHAPGKTDIRPSPIHGYVEPITKPAKLYDAHVNILHKNVEKCAINTPYIPKAEVDRAVNEVQSLLLSGDTRKYLARILTYEEAVAGSSDSQYIVGIHRQSSAGYPHVFNVKPGFQGKTTWFGKDGDYIFDEGMRKLVLERIENARNSKRTPTVWTDTLKDERRPIAKVDQNKTRVFAHGPIDYTLAVRMYYGGFIAHIMENKITNEQSVGTNCFGPDWMRTATKLSKYGKRVFAGDFSTFDGTLNSCIMERFADVANKFYNDGEENATIRRVLLLEVFNSVHLCGNKFIQLTHSQPSGNPLTTILNSFYNSVSMRVAYYRCFDGVAPPFMENVSMVSYGDDNVINFTGNVAEQFNQNTVTKAFASFGMIYTDESKSTGTIAPWRTIGEVDYLKRRFRMVEGTCRAPLALPTILESCNWVRKSSDDVGACKQICEMACRELAQYPNSVFVENVNLIVDAFYQATNEYPLIKTQADYLADQSPQF